MGLELGAGGIEGRAEKRHVVAAKGANTAEL